MAPLSQRETSMTHRGGGGFEVVAKIEPREPRSLYDLASGLKIGDVVIDDDAGTARITDPVVVAAIKASAAAGRGFSMGYRVTLEPSPAESAPCAPLVDLVSDARLREIANGVDIEIGPWAEVGAAERFAAELHTMAAELLAVRVELSRLALDCQRWLTESDDRPNLRAAESRVRLLARGSR